MNHILKHVAVIVLCAIALPAIGQLSPGDLARPHADLEGISNCTKCHTLGDKVSNDKCLDCHNFIRERIASSSGYHASSEVRGKNCFECHSDHHGRNFEMTRFETSTFNHELTGYSLTGKHAAIDCRECHKPENIENRELRDRTDTYLGLSTECLSCHDDYHQGTLSNNCTSCHNTQAFSPAANFDHADTEFPLRGQHAQVECIECHAVGLRAGREFREFSGIAFANCSDCHTDVHRGRLGPNCAGCHQEDSFLSLVASVRFDHSRTEFPLTGRHRSVSCTGCHTAGGGPETVFSDFSAADFNACTLCHEDVHEGRFGADCRQCHTVETFRVGSEVEGFNHDLTDFPLEGKHEVIDCRECHETKLTDPMEHAFCADCHQDYHEGQLVSTALIEQTDCADCHSPDGFQGSSFSIDQHNAGAFPLTGAHLATPCFACHLIDDSWQFRNIGERCVDCHEDIHEGLLSVDYYPGQACTNCHITDTWREIRFAHEQTGFELEGVHSTIRCGSCHNPEPDQATMEGQMFVGLETACESCHSDHHQGQFARDASTDCFRCHGFSAWKPSSFDHDSAAFTLDGAHVNVACAECHVPVIENGEPFVFYHIESFDCIDCHD